MNKTVIRVAAVVLVVAMAMSVVGMAAAQGPDRRGDNVRDRRPVTQFLGDAVDEVAALTGLTNVEILAALRDGTTVAELLEANGSDPAALVETLTASAEEAIAQAVADGKLTQEQADTALAALPDSINTLVYESRDVRDTPVRDRVEDVVDNSLAVVLAELAGVDLRQMVKDALTPPTLAELAESYGLDADAVIAEAEARVTEDVAARVEAGTLTQEQADEILAGLHDRLVERFNNPLPSLRDRLPGDLGDRLPDNLRDRMPGRAPNGQPNNDASAQPGATGQSL